MKQVCQTFRHFSSRAFVSDDAQKGSTSGDIGELTDAMDNYQYTKDHWLLNGYWDGHFNFIYACNDILHEIDSLKLTDPGSIINEAETRFMRAYAYFDLVRDYGEVPIIDFKVYQPGDANKPKNTVAEIYTFIDNDLQFADANLPLTWGKSISRKSYERGLQILYMQRLCFIAKTGVERWQNVKK
jgi:hypothetical protein